jgi:hypothetical protein
MAKSKSIYSLKRQLASEMLLHLPQMLHAKLYSVVHFMNIGEFELVELGILLSKESGSSLVDNPDGYYKGWLRSRSLYDCPDNLKWYVTELFCQLSQAVGAQFWTDGKERILESPYANCNYAFRVQEFGEPCCEVVEMEMSCNEPILVHVVDPVVDEKSIDAFDHGWTPVENKRRKKVARQFISELITNTSTSRGKKHNVKCWGKTRMAFSPPNLSRLKHDTVVCQCTSHGTSRAKLFESKPPGRFKCTTPALLPTSVEAKSRGSRPP